jgi:hypothetical protein
MLMDAVRWLRESGVTVAQNEIAAAGDVRADAVLDVTLGEQSARFAVEVKQRAPYPNELGRLRQLRKVLSQWGEPLLVVPYLREEVGATLSQDGWSWADSLGNFDLRAPGLILRQRRPGRPPKPARTLLPRGSGSFAVMRALIRLGDGQEGGTGATAMANQARVSQPRASQVLHQLLEQHLVERVEHGQWQPHREALLDRFLAEYPGPGGSEQLFYTLDSPAHVAVDAARRLGDQIAVSADVGPDLLVAWRRPSVLIAYVRRLVDPAELGLVEAQGRHDANVIIRMPADQSVFGIPALVADLQGVDVALADPAQMVWDLLDLGGADRAEAAGRLREWLLARRWAA